MEINLWMWLVVGLLPYRTRKWSLAGGGYKLEVRALFWSLTVHERRSGRRDWTIHIPLIERLRDAVWAAVMRLRDGEPTANDEDEDEGED